MRLFSRLRETFQTVCVVFSRKLASAGKEIKDNFLRALAEREEANRSGKMTVSTLLQHANCYVMGFPSNISAILLGWEQNLYCVKFTQHAPQYPPTPPNSISSSLKMKCVFFFYQPACPTFPQGAYFGLYMPPIICTGTMAQKPLVAGSAF